MNIIPHIIRPASLLILSMIAVSATAQSVFKGQIKDDKQQPIAFANVILLNPADSSFVEGTVSKADGSFSITTKKSATTNYILKISSTGYTTQYRQVQQPGDLGTFELKTDVIQLKGATVTAQRPSFSLEKGGITANIENSVLSRETSANDVLRKLPGLMEKDGQVQTFTGDKPLIYVNGKKVTDYSIVKNMPVKDIKTVRLINNPGAEYDAETKCVLLITTKKRLEGLSMQVDLEGKRNHYNSHNEGVNLSYTTGKITIFANGNYEDTRAKDSENDELKNTLAKETYTNFLTSWGWNKNPYTTYALGFNYDINEKNHWGVEYSGSTSRSYNNDFMKNSTYLNDEQFDHVLSTSNGKDKSRMSHVNAFYTGTFSPKANFKLYADYLYNNTHSYQLIEENSTVTAERTIGTNSDMDYNIYATKALFGYTFNPANSLNIGSEYSFTNGTSSYNYSDGSYPSDYGNIERKIAGFTEYNFRKKRFSLTAGLRYEFVNSDLTNYLDNTQNLHRNYSNLLPSLSLNYATSKMFNHSLSFRSSVLRPDFQLLSGTSNYINRYSRQLSNPRLQPLTNYHVQYTFLYKTFMLQANYNYFKDYMGVSMTTDEKEPAVILITTKNFDHNQTISFIASYNNRWGLYQPSVTAALFKDFFKTEYLGKPTRSNNPIVQIDWNNGFYLPAGFFFNAEYQYTSSGSAQMMQLRPTHILNLSLQKSLLQDKLTFTLEGNDLLNKSNQRIRGGIGTVYLKTNQFYDRRSVSLHITYRFNSQNKKEYKGMSAAESETERLKKSK